MPRHAALGAASVFVCSGVGAAYSQPDDPQPGVFAGSQPAATGASDPMRDDRRTRAMLALFRDKGLITVEATNHRVQLSAFYLF